MTESFNDVLAVFRRYSSDECFGLCGEEGNCNECMARMADRLEQAHKRELEQARDPQRIRGAKPDTFDGAVEALREFRWQHATNDKDVIPYINAVKEAHDREFGERFDRSFEQIRRDYQSDHDARHDRELEKARREWFHRGYEAGIRKRETDTWQRNQERAMVVGRLRSLVFDGGSHENLSKVAYAVYPCATGWTCESTAGLRDRLVQLLGGDMGVEGDPKTPEFVESPQESPIRGAEIAVTVGHLYNFCPSCGARIEGDQ